MKTPYDNAFYAILQGGSRKSAEAIVPLLIEMVAPRSVVDVGCGIGAWLSVFRARGVSDILGVDGAYVSREQHEVPPEHFRAHDLTTPLQLGRSFDLALSVEVAEHLPAGVASTFVAGLVALAPVVAFSAAIPHQGGVQHVNERWPTYWAHLFANHGYVVVDAVRPRVWHDQQINWWYAQNLLVYVKKDMLDSYPALATARRQTQLAYLDVVHPSNYLGNAYLPEYWVPRASLRTLLRSVPNALGRSLQRYVLRAR